MHSKWTDALIQVLAFDRIHDHHPNLEGEPFCEHIVLLFTQLSALATIYLSGETLPRGEGAPPPSPEPRRRNRRSSMVSSSAVAARLSTSCSTGRLSTSGMASGALRAAGRFGRSGRGHSGKASLAKTSKETGVLDEDQKRGVHKLFEPFDDDEREWFFRVPDKVHTQIARINRAITTRHIAGGVRAPAPIVSRVFQEISNGALAYNSATKMSEIPVPFMLVHLHALLLALWSGAAPMVLGCYTGHVVLSAFLASVVVGGFAALWLIANDMEDPFGHKSSDLPLLLYHEDYVAAIESSLSQPWMRRDQWLIKEGAWKPPELTTGEQLRSDGQRCSDAQAFSANRSPYVLPRRERKRSSLLKELQTVRDLARSGLSSSSRRSSTTKFAAATASAATASSTPPASAPGSFKANQGVRPASGAPAAAVDECGSRALGAGGDVGCSRTSAALTTGSSATPPSPRSSVEAQFVGTLSLNGAVALGGLADAGARPEEGTAGA